MTRAQKWLAWAAIFATMGCGEDGGGSSDDGVECGTGTSEVDGVCVAKPADGTNGGGNNGAGNSDATPDPDPDPDPDPVTARTCGAGTTEVEGVCIANPGPKQTLSGFTVTQMSLRTRGKVLTGAVTDPTLSVHHPIDVTVGIRYEGDPATIPLVIALGEAGAGAAVTGDGFCLLGGLSIQHTGQGEAVATQRMFLQKDCLSPNTEATGGADVATRVLNPVVLVDPDQTLDTDVDMPKGIVFALNAQKAALDAAAAQNEALVNGTAPAKLEAADLSLSQCRGGAGGDAGSCALNVNVKASDGVDFELTDVKLESSVFVLNRCFADQAALNAAATTDGMPTGYLCNRSIVRGLDAAGEPLPEGNPKDYTYGAADIELDSTVTSFGLDDSPVESADELMGMGTMTPDGFKLNVDPEDIANNALSGSESYTVRYFLRPASVSLEDASQDSSLAAAIARQGGYSTLVTGKKLLPIYLHAEGEQAKADGESVGGQEQVGLEETVSIPQAPSEYNHGLYVENDCGRFNDPTGRPGSYRQGTPACTQTVNPRDEMLYGAFKDEKDFFVVACLTAAPGATLPDSDDIDNNCVERPIKLARVEPREARFAAENPGVVNPFAEDPDTSVLAKAGFTRDELFGAADSATAYAANYDWDNSFGNDNISLNVHAHTRNALSLQNGASTDNEAKLYLRSGTFDFTLDIVRIWAQAAARTIVVGSYYDYGLSFFGVQFIGERKEAEFHKEWDWNITKEWSKDKSIFVKVAWVDVGFKAAGQLGFKIDLDVVARELSEQGEPCELAAGDCDCTTPECSALKTNFPNSDAIGEASLTLTPYGNIKANVYAAISIQIARAGAAGEITLADISVPAKAAINWGFDGSVKAPQNGTLKLAAWANIQFKSTFLKGRIYLFAENRSIDWCRKWWSPPYPCGVSWSQFWDYTIASWNGWSYDQLLWASPVYRADLTRNGLSIPQPVFDSSKYYMIQAVHSNKCIDAPGTNNSYQWDCHGQAWQRWRFVDIGGGRYYILSQHHNKALDIAYASTGNGAVGQPSHPWINVDNQKVTLEAKGDAYIIKFVHSGKCMDISGASQNNGAAFQQWDCHGGNNQLFRLRP